MNEDKDIEELTEDELDRELTRISAGERHDKANA